MQLLDYWRIIRKRWLLVLALTVLATAYAVVQVVSYVPVYRTSTTLFLNPAASNPLLPLQATQTMQATANTYIQFMRTRSFATLVAEQSGLALSPGNVLAALSAEYIPDTQFFVISATHVDPNAAQVIANTAAETLIAENTARRQVEQAQLESQLGRNPERQRLIELRDRLQEELDLYNQRIDNTREQIASLEARAPSERNNQRLTELRAELIQLLATRSATLNSLAQVQAGLAQGSSTAGAATSTSTAVIVDPAILPALPQPQPVTRTLLTWIIFGMLAGIALAVALEYLDYTVRTPEALEQTYGMPTMGVIGLVGGRRKTPELPNAPNPIYRITVSDPRSPTAESIRSLRTSVQVAALSRPLRTLMVTSAGPSEGKTFVAANLAVSMAQYGNTVVLVDLDLRKPKIHTVFGMQREPGFTNLVIGHEADTLAAIKPHVYELAERLQQRVGARGEVLVANEEGGHQLTMSLVQRLIRRAETEAPELAGMVAELRAQLARSDDPTPYLRTTEIPNLFVLPCGTLPPQPSELLGSPRAVQVMERLNSYADLVIYDTPPSGIVTDAVVLAPRMDAVLQVVRAGATRIDMIRRSKATLQQTGAHMLGPVLNQVKLADMGSYSYYYYYGYGTEGTRNKRNGKTPDHE
ncbi:MAG: Wzz/FepE/Etk N-terminal domain-containing protein [Oscillochloridaceae bacterium umkhey_bin13]